MIAVTGGGTGGHIFPNIAVIEELRRRNVKDIVWIGSRDGMERLWAEKLGVPYYPVRTGKLRRYFTLKNFIDPFFVFIGFLQSLLLLSRLRPEVLFSKGGFVAVPPVIAARLLGIPVVTHESDKVPGLATKIISLFASAICVGFETTGGYFKKKRVIFTGNPIREIVKRSNPQHGKKFLGFKQELPMVLVIGGSLGASSINRAVWELCEKKPFRFNLVHQCGSGNKKDKLEIINYRQFEFLEDEMGDVLGAADIVVSRAGAGILYEIGYLGKPSILIPLPGSKSRGEQIENARYFVRKGAALLIPEEKLSGSVLLNELSQLLDDTERLKIMGRNALAIVKTDAEKEISDIILGIHKK